VKYNHAKRRNIVVFVDGSSFADTAFMSAIRMKEPSDILRVVYLVPESFSLIATPSGTKKEEKLPHHFTDTHSGNNHGHKHSVSEESTTESGSSLLQITPPSNPCECIISAYMEKYKRFIETQRRMQEAHQKEDQWSKEHEKEGENVYDNIIFTTDIVPNINDAAINVLNQSKADLAIVGSRDNGPLKRLLSGGSFSRHLSSHAPCDVYIAKSKEGGVENSKL